MENFRKFRDDLAGALKETRETNPEQAEQILDAVKESDIYKIAKKEHQGVALGKIEEKKKENIGKVLELHKSNIEKLESIMGKKLEDEIDILFSLSNRTPEILDRAIYILEEKIKAEIKPKDELVEEFITWLKESKS
jgi:hypothetical protein